jgi:hypothetical protein
MLKISLKNQFEALLLLIQNLIKVMIHRSDRRFLHLSLPIFKRQLVLDVLNRRVLRYEIGSWLIDGSAVLELYGVRPSNDLDYVSTTPKFKINSADCHNTEYARNPSSVMEVVFDPRRHFRFKGIKFLSLGELVSQKINHNDFKSKQDVYFVGAAIKNLQLHESFSDRPQKLWQWKFRIFVGRLLERLISRIPSSFQQNIRKGLRNLAKLIFHD